MIAHKIEQRRASKNEPINQDSPNGVGEDPSTDSMPGGELPTGLTTYKPTRVLVVDDDLAGFVFAQVRESEPRIEEILGDSTSPEVEELLDICRGEIDVTDYKKDFQSFCKFLLSNDFISKVLCKDWFRGKASQRLQEVFVNFFARVDRGASLRNEFMQAFPETHYQIDFQPSWRSESETLSYDCIFLDLVLVGSATPVDDTKAFLKKLSLAAGDQEMPPIIIMSTAGDELRAHRKEFSKVAKISAAGLWVLPKSDLESPNFKARGLRILFEQLMVQRSAAHRMRGFIQSWAIALTKAAEDAETTLWNLDASAVQRIHFTAIGDNDPFDGHFSDLISREYLWNVEQNSNVVNAIKELDECLRGHINGSGGIKHRFMSPIVDPEVTRNFFSHYVWTGWPSGRPFYYGAGIMSAEQQFNATLPFGSVLASNLTAGNECLIHITQQCDLNASTRPHSEPRSAVFAIAKVHEALQHYLSRFDNSELVAVGLKAATGEFDLKYVPGRMLAMPISRFLEWAEQSKLCVVGRLRFDVASQFAQAAANQLTRPATFKMARESSLPVKVFLIGKNIPQKPTPTVYEHVPGQVREVMASLSADGRIISFPDDDGLRIAVWVQRMVEEHCKLNTLSFVQLANKLRHGAKISGDELLHNLRLRVIYCQKDAEYNTAKSLQPPKPPEITLLVIGDEAMKVP